MALKGKLKITEVEDLKFCGPPVVTQEIVNGIPLGGEKHELFGSGPTGLLISSSPESEPTVEQSLLGS